MVSIPRIVTVDPTGMIARIVRSAMELLDLSVIQTDIPSVTDALSEISPRVNLVVTTVSLTAEMKGFEFANRVQQNSGGTSIIILADENDPEEVDLEAVGHSPLLARIGCGARKPISYVCRDAKPIRTHNHREQSRGCA
jgi:CheY-like chemotaxis protein